MGRSGWLDNHPGGLEVVLLMAGRDATDAFASYHPFTDKPRKVSKTGYVPSFFFCVRVQQCGARPLAGSLLCCAVVCVENRQHEVG